MPVLLCLILLPVAQAAPAGSHALSANTELAIEGYFVLSWALPAAPGTGTAYELQQADNPDFLEPTRTTITAAGDITLSGFRDGTYYFRAGDGSTWTQTVAVTVDHPPIAQALAFFLLGLTLFIILIICIMAGNQLHHTHFNNGSKHD